jgi:hypothetical protein
MKSINVGRDDGGGYVSVAKLDLPPEFIELIRHMQDAWECEYTWSELAELLDRAIIDRDQQLIIRTK